MTTHRRRLIILGLLAAALGACDRGPTAPSSAPSAPAAVVAPVAPAAPAWPVAHPDGAFGHEDPRYPPAPALCPVDYWPTYNGWNWLCQGGFPWLREFPSTRWRQVTP